VFLEVNIELTTNFLGGGQRVNGVRKLKKSPDSRIAVNEKEWKEDLKKVAEQLEIEIDIDSFRFDTGFEFPEVNVLRRVYNKTNVDLFEGISAGNQISLYVAVPVKPENGLKDIETIFSLFGKFYGISQFGKKFHCGRFKLISINKLTKENI
jgi:hypothetical protein